MVDEWNIAQKLGAAMNHEFTNFKGKLTPDKYEECTIRAWVRTANSIKESEKRQILPFQDLYLEPVASLNGNEVKIFPTYELKPETLFYVLKRNIKGDE
jgi:L-arabinose isomerase